MVLVNEEIGRNINLKIDVRGNGLLVVVSKNLYYIDFPNWDSLE